MVAFGCTILIVVSFLFIIIVFWHKIIKRNVYLHTYAKKKITFDAFPLNVFSKTGN